MISTIEDDFIKSYYENRTKWVVKLNDGTMVYQDDGRPEIDRSAWLRLKDFCNSQKSKLYIVDFYLQNRSHIETLPTNMYGYYFRFGISAVMNGESCSQYITGYLKNNQLHIIKWKIPELIITDTEVREIDYKDEALII